jgi:hypothetical protein
MAVKPFRLFLIVLILILAGIAVTLVAKSRLSISSEVDNNKFITTYIALATAKEQLSSSPDSLKKALHHIFNRYGTDSLWMDNYARNLSKNLSKSLKTWDMITGRLDSLRNIPYADSISIY